MTRNIQSLLNALNEAESHLAAAKANHDAALTDRDTKLAAFQAAVADLTPETSARAVACSFDFTFLDALIRRFGWAGNNPRGSFPDGPIDYQKMRDGNQPALAGQYFLSPDPELKHMSGEEQIKRAKILITPDDMPEHTREKGRAAVAEYLRGEGYIFLDLRAELYLEEHPEERQRLFESTAKYRKAHGNFGYIWLFFMGSTVRCASGIASFPAMEMDASDRNLDGGWLRSGWGSDDFALVLET